MDFKNCRNLTLKVGDKVRIADSAPPDKRGKEGIIEVLAVNGAIVKLGKYWFTPVQRKHLIKL